MSMLFCPIVFLSKWIELVLLFERFGHEGILFEATYGLMYNKCAPKFKVHWF